MINLLLLLIAIILFAVLAPLGFAYTVISSILYLKNPFKYISYIIKKLAVSIDQMGNVVCGDLFNIILVKSGTPFGDEKDTISKVLHINNNNLTKLGLSIYLALEIIDPGHGKKSMID